MKLIPFDLAKCIAGEPVVTRDLKPYKFLDYDPHANVGSKICGRVDHGVVSHDEYGKFFIDRREAGLDLFHPAPVTQYWVALFCSRSVFFASVGKTREEAINPINQEQYTLLKCELFYED